MEKLTLATTRSSFQLIDDIGRRNATNTKERATSKVKRSSKRLKSDLEKSSSKSEKYVSTILKTISSLRDDLGIEFVKLFKINLSKDSKLQIKKAAHQTLNDLITLAKLTTEEVRKITNLSWKTIYKVEKPPVAKSSSFAKRSHLISSSSTNRQINSEKINAPEGFLWKPVADSPPHGLAVLLPESWTGKITGLHILSPDGNTVLANGRDGGVGNGNRQHYRFDMQGTEFPNDAIVRVLLSDGTVRDIVIANPSKRLEGR